MSSGSIRIIQLPEKSSVNTDDYMAVDSSANGTKKVKFTDLLDNNLSAQNKAADAQATGEAIGELNTDINNTNTRIDNIINTQQNASVTTLWTGILNTYNQEVTLSDNVSNYDFIDIYVSQLDYKFLRRPVNAIGNTIQLQGQNMLDSGSTDNIEFWEGGLNISGNKAKITKANSMIIYGYDTYTKPTGAVNGSIPNITRIDGVKIGHVENDEIVDARIGDDGVTYPTLGDAIRTQVGDLKSDLKEVSGTEEIQFQMGYSIVLDGSPIDLTPIATWGNKCANIACSEGDIFTISGIGISTHKWLYAFLDSSNNVLSYLVSASVQQTNLEVVAPENSAKLIINNYIGSGTGDSSYKGLINISDSVYALKENGKNIGYLKTAVGYEACSFLDGKAIRTPASGTVDFTPMDVGSVSCCVIDCEKGDVFTISGTPRSNSGTRPYMFVGTDDKVVYRSELTTELIDYSVVAPADGKLVVNLLLNQAHSVQKGYNNISKKLADYYTFKSEPLTNLPDYFVNNLAYKPIGQLEKGYLCLSCDDGAVELGTYTIPMIEAKNVPCTFSLWSTSAVLTDYSEDVVDAIENHGCELSQHGNQIWAEEDGAIAFTEERLRSFFDAEQAVWDSLGIVPKSAVCPAHYNNALVRAVAGGRFGVVRSGLDYVDNHYTYYTSGARSNLFGMSSQNVNGGSLAYWESVIDYAYDNNKIINLYWHDWDLNAEQKATLEAVIDYAKTKGITFCTLGEIAHIL